MDVREPRPPALTEGTVRKGGQNLEYQIRPDQRPPDPPPMRPERAGREGDQPLPTPGKRDVLADLAVTVPVALAARRAIGIRRYGRPLETWNGRDVHQDLDDELLDALAYARQAKQERRDLEVALADERGTRAALEDRIFRIRSLVPQDILRGARDTEHAVELLATALDLEVAARKHLEERIGA